MAAGLPGPQKIAQCHVEFAGCKQVWLISY